LMRMPENAESARSILKATPLFAALDQAEIMSFERVR
jgi:hypothetical protein